MTDTANLAMTEYVEGQNSGFATINNFLHRLDAAVLLTVKDKDLNTPPGSPASGDRYIVGTSPTGAWSGKAKQIAAYYGGWIFLAPKEGWEAWVDDEDIRYRYDGTNWVTANGDGLEFNSSQLRVKLDGSTLARSANGLKVADAAGLTTQVAASTTAARGAVKQATAIADLDQTITNPPTQAEVQAITDKIDALLAAMRTAGILAT